MATQQLDRSPPQKNPLSYTTNFSHKHRPTCMHEKRKALLLLSSYNQLVGEGMPLVRGHDG